MQKHLGPIIYQVRPAAQLSFPNSEFSLTLTLLLKKNTEHSNAVVTSITKKKDVPEWLHMVIQPFPQEKIDLVNYLQALSTSVGDLTKKDIMMAMIQLLDNDVVCGQY